MRFSQLFGRTLREVPAEAELVSHQLLLRAAMIRQLAAGSHQLLLRAAMIRQLAAGIYSYLPLGWRVLAKIQAILREEMDRIGGQELLMPVVHPAEVWQATGWCTRQRCGRRRGAGRLPAPARP